MIQSISTIDLKERLSQGAQITIIDVRESDEVAEGMIPGAIHIPLGDIPSRYQEIQQQGDIILVCRSGKRSQKAYEFLENQGYKNLFNMDGGMLQW
ncbi:rhodanese-like domain-containing protein [Paenibacillus psychroresistens]|uniref:Rhodanese-like domain-containing protein n=1 Tax=Paenibacillus psychroresistens TaxID=1778678 RepID=A0A6B8RMA5_9BACL|nr:rhodanese-like domain-containing protein [Paenibacillus psychroresistens]QGQ96987.1 rhodanese-like domain-containing protein [Paenibacillus psychroresistens]